jgi:hypothetical protein
VFCLFLSIDFTEGFLGIFEQELFRERGLILEVEGIFEIETALFYLGLYGIF